MKFTPIQIATKEYVARNIDPTNAAQMAKVHKLRNDIFVKKLAWVPGHYEDFERDEYDAYSIFFGVFKGEELLATARMTPSTGLFMIERALAYTMEGAKPIQKGEDTVELSRLGCSPSIIDRTVRTKVSMALYKLLYEWSRENGIRYWYLVSTEAYLGAIRKKLGIPVAQIGKTFATEQGEEYYAAVIDLRAAERALGVFKLLLFRSFLRPKRMTIR
ncbi:MAG: hypothetical protein A2542_01055 [Parcubacteria group bacterium RIFOXYD2_FULL_52_8]|nr:MAG: hypothetical protein A2542_01055 [Parcubacteria group bacterium RIFOXYD2_FULL_52_8]